LMTLRICLEDRPKVAATSRSRKDNPFRLRGCHPLWPTFPDRSAKDHLFYFPAGSWPRPTKPRNPKKTTPTSYSVLLVWASPVSFARTHCPPSGFTEIGVRILIS
jgi:hypothetical protein